MASKVAFEAMDMLLQHLTQNDCPFGGKVVIVGGDFCQTSAGRLVSNIRANNKEFNIRFALEIGVRVLCGARCTRVFEDTSNILCVRRLRVHNLVSELSG